MGVGSLGSIDDLFDRDARISVTDVADDGVVKQHCLLGDATNIFPQMLQTEILKGYPVELDAT